jgi:excisionase family DNA binding protein
VTVDRRHSAARRVTAVCGTSRNVRFPRGSRAASSRGRRPSIAGPNGTTRCALAPAQLVVEEAHRAAAVMPDETAPLFYTVEKLAKRWLVSPRTIRRLIENGDLRAIRVDTQLRVSAQVVARYEERHETVAAVRAGRPGMIKVGGKANCCAPERPLTLCPIPRRWWDRRVAPPSLPRARGDRGAPPAPLTQRLQGSRYRPPSRAARCVLRNARRGHFRGDTSSASGIARRPGVAPRPVPPDH